MCVTLSTTVPHVGGTLGDMGDILYILWYVGVGTVPHVWGTVGDMGDIIYPVVCWWGEGEGGG